MGEFFVVEAVSDELADALVPVLRDLEATCPLVPQIEPDQWTDVPGQLAAMSWWPAGNGCGVSVLASETTEQRIASVADQLQEPVVEGLPQFGLPAVWPECPEHPDGHPLRALVADGIASWVCPMTGHRVEQIGQLAATLNGRQKVALASARARVRSVE
jgi:hypothetical protein